MHGPYVMPQKVLFKHCDPAGIVFYPRYFEMINDCVECFFDEVVGFPFEAMHPDAGVPTAQVSVEFHAPSRHGDRLELALACKRLGRSSLGIEIVASCSAERRFTATQTLVLIDGQGRPRPWTETQRKILGPRVERPAA